MSSMNDPHYIDIAHNKQKMTVQLRIEKYNSIHFPVTGNLETLVLFFLFCIRLAKLVELGEFNQN